MKSKSNTEPKICIEVTNTQRCIVIELATLPLCPSHCMIPTPTSVTDIDVGGSILHPTLISKWENFRITDSITQKVVSVPEMKDIGLLEAYKLKAIIRHPFFVHLYLQDHCSFEKLM